MSLSEQFVKRAFDVRVGEGKRTSLMFLYIFLIISTLLIIKPVSISLFLSEFGARQLPFAYIMVAIFAAVVVTVYSRLLKQGNLQHTIIQTLKFSIVSLFVVWFFLYLHLAQNFVLYVFYIWVAIFAVISTSQFWILANIIFNAREAKRLFGIIGSGAIAGGIFGGYLTNWLAPVISSENLLFICMGFIAVCMQIVRFLWKANIRDYDSRYYQHAAVQRTIENPLKIIQSSRHLTLLACIVGIGVLVARLVDYQFSAISARMIYSEDQLTAFFGFWLSNLNIASLFIQLLVTRKVVGVFGVGVSLFFLPVGIFLGAFFILLNPVLWTAVLIKVIDGSLKNSINKAGIELLALPIPVEIKNQAKSFIDVFVDSLATGVGGFLLVLFIMAFSFSTRQISFLIILFLGAWIFLATRIRKEYIHSFRLKVEAQKNQQEKEIPDLENESVIGGLTKVLNGTNEKQILQALRMVKEIQNPKLVPCFKKLIDHPSREIRIEVLCNIYYYRQEDFTAEIESLLYDSDPDIRLEAIHYIFQHAGEDRINVMLGYLDHESDRIRSAALLCAAKESRNNRQMQIKLAIKQRVEKNLKKLPTLSEPGFLSADKINSAKVIGASSIPELYPYLHILLNDPLPEVRKAAILSAGETRHNEFIPILIRSLRARETRQAAQSALVNFGPEIIDILNVHLNNPYVNLQIRLSIPKIIASLRIQQSVDELIQNLELQDVSVRYEVIKALNQLKQNNPLLKFEVSNIVKRIYDEVKDYVNTMAVLQSQLQTRKKKRTAKHIKEVDSDEIRSARLDLIKALEKRLDQNLERIFRLLGLRYPPEDIYNIYLGIRSSKPDARINAIEFLDNLLDTSLKKLIIPIVETSLVDDLINKMLERFGLKPSSEFDYLVNLLSSQDSYLQQKVLYLIAQLKDERYVSFIGAFISSPDSRVRKMARLALSNLDLSI